MLSAITKRLTQSAPTKTATLINGKMILSFPQAVKPVLWQMDIATVKISAIEIETTPEGATLILKSPASDNITIATFSDHDIAVEQLIIVSKALTQSHGHLTHKTQSNAPFFSSIWGKTIKIIAILLGLWIVISVIGAVTYNSQNPSTNATIEDRPTDGQPLSADDFLQGR